MAPIFATAVMWNSPYIGMAIVLSSLCCVLAVVAVIVSSIYHALPMRARRPFGWAVAALAVVLIASTRLRADGMIYMTDQYCVYYWFDIFTCWPW